MTLEVWSDFQCPAFGQFAELVEPTLIREYVTTGTPFRDWLFANQVGENEGAFRDERLRAIATAAGLDGDAWDACRATAAPQSAVRAETQQGFARGVSATQTMFLYRARRLGGTPIRIC